MTEKIPMPHAGGKHHPEAPNLCRCGHHVSYHEDGGKGKCRAMFQCSCVAFDTFMAHPAWAILAQDKAIVRLEAELAQLRETVEAHCQRQADVHGLTTGPTDDRLGQLSFRLDQVCVAVKSQEVQCDAHDRWVGPTNDRLEALEQRIEALEGSVGCVTTGRADGHGLPMGPKEQAVTSGIDSLHPPLCGKHATRSTMERGGYINWSGGKYERWFCDCGTHVEIYCSDASKAEAECADLRRQLDAQTAEVARLKERAEAAEYNFGELSDDECLAFVEKMGWQVSGKGESGIVWFQSKTVSFHGESAPGAVVVITDPSKLFAALRALRLPPWLEAKR